MTDASDITAEPSGADRFRIACEAVGACGGRVCVLCGDEGGVFRATMTVCRNGAYRSDSFVSGTLDGMWCMLAASAFDSRDRMIGLVEVER